MTERCANPVCTSHSRTRRLSHPKEKTLAGLQLRSQERTVSSALIPTSWVTSIVGVESVKSKEKKPRSHVERQGGTHTAGKERQGRTSPRPADPQQTTPARTQG